MVCTRTLVPALIALTLVASSCALPIFGKQANQRDERRARSAPRNAARDTGTARARDAHTDALARADADPEACTAALTARGVVFDRIRADDADGVRMPVRLRGPLDGVEVTAQGPGHSAAILDCRLALALLSWAPTLRRAGITRIEHYSIYRPGSRVGGSRRESGHARGLAIDAARFYLRNGTALDVLNDWEERDRGGAPCPRRSDEAWPSRLLRGVVCDAVDNKLFQVVITPHHDRAHGNHVHLERKPEVSWTYVR